MLSELLSVWSCAVDLAAERRDIFGWFAPEAVEGDDGLLAATLITSPSISQGDEVRGTASTEATALV